MENMISRVKTISWYLGEAYLKKLKEEGYTIEVREREEPTSDSKHELEMERIRYYQWSRGGLLLPMRQFQELVKETGLSYNDDPRIFQEAQLIFQNFVENHIAKLADFASILMIHRGSSTLDASDIQVAIRGIYGDLGRDLL